MLHLAGDGCCAISHVYVVGPNLKAVHACLRQAAVRQPARQRGDRVARHAKGPHRAAKDLLGSFQPLAQPPTAAGQACTGGGRAGGRLCEAPAPASPAPGS